MKPLRLFVLILLTVLLPVRGVLAATMLCPQGSTTGTSAAVTVVSAEHAHEHEHHAPPADPGPHAEHAAAHANAHAHASHASGDATAAPGEHPTACGLCASGCCMASIVGVLAPIAAPGPTASVAFARVSAPVAAFQSGGQDRPPRTC